MRVLVVEDETLLADHLRRGLVAEGFEVDVVHDGDRGLQWGMSGGYDLILLDLMLPHLSGFRVCEGLRRNGVPTPILVLTAKDGEVDHADALDGGADDYLTKPFSYPVLMAHVRALLRRAAPPTSPSIQLGPVTLHSEHLCVERDGHRVALTGLEFRLLAELSRHPGRVVSKRELLGELWPDTASDDNLVEAAIARVRRKLATIDSDGVLDTVRGVGYRIDVRA